MVLSENVRLTVAAHEWSIKTFKVLLFCHGVAFPVDKNDAAMYKVSKNINQYHHRLICFFYAGEFCVTTGKEIGPNSNESEKNEECHGISDTVKEEIEYCDEERLV